MSHPLAPSTSNKPSTPSAALPLPDKPHLDQLRHQARDLLSRAQQSEPEAVARLAAIDKGTTLAAAQLAIARGHGFASWERLKEEVERRLSAPPAHAAPRYGIRQVTSLEELGRVCDVIGAQITPPMARDDRRFQELWPRFEADSALMWLAETDGEIVGGALGFRPNGGAITVRAIGVAPHARRQGLGRRLLAALELEAMKLGGGGINLAATDDARGFYQRLGYAGRGSLMQKGFPLPGRLLEARLKKLAREVGAA